MKEKERFSLRTTSFFLFLLAAVLLSVLGFAVIDRSSSTAPGIIEPEPLEPIDPIGDRDGRYPPEENLAPIKPQYAEDQLIIKLKDNASLSTIQSDPAVQSVNPLFSHLSGLVGESRDSAAARGLDRVHLVAFDSSTTLASMVQKYRDDPDVEYVQPNFLYEPDLVPNDPLYGQQYAHQLTQAEAAWDYTTGSPDVVIAVIGVGVDLDHPDLAANIWINNDEIPGNGIDDDSNGYIDDVNGWNFANNNNNPNPSAGYHHETMVAGVAAAVGNNGIGVCGITWSCRIMPLRVEYTSDDVAAAVEYARANGAHVINMSFGNYDRSKYGDGVVKEMLDDAYTDGLLLVATAGNNQKDWRRYPAALYNVMAVGATDQNDRRAKWGYYYTSNGSNYGPWVDLAAPGSDILSTNIGGYDSGDGTSYAAPYVAGLGALVLSYATALDNIALRAVLENTTDPIPLDTSYHSVGTGRVNAWQAVSTSGTAYPLGEIASPENKEFVSEDLQQVPLVFLAHGDTYRVDYQAFGEALWAFIAQGDPAQDTGPDGLVHLTFANPGHGTFMLRLTVTSNGNSHVDTKIFAVEGHYQAGWPVKPSENKRYLKSNAICMDIDEDGENEIIQSTYADNTKRGYTYIWNQDGSNLAGWPKYLGGDPSCSTSAVGDVDGDGDYEVVTTTYDGGYVYVWHWQNAELLDGDWPKNFGNFIRANPVLADLDGDGDAEIIVAVAHVAGQYTGIHVFQHDGTLVWYTYIDNVQAPMAVADLDGDGNIEIAVSAWNDTYVLDHEGVILRQWSGGSHKPLAIADLDWDGVLEIISVNGNYSKLRALHLSGAPLWEVPTGSNLMHGYGATSVGDLSGDGYPEIFVANSYGYTTNNKIYGWDHTGSPLTALGFPRDSFGHLSQSAPAVGDINGDGHKEVLVGSTSELLFAWDRNGNPVNTFPRLMGDWIWTTATMADLDQDGDIEIMLGQDDGAFVVWDLPGSYNPTNIDWGMYRHDPQGSGLALRAPTLDRIDIPGTIHAGETLQFQLTADNPDNMALHFYVRQMPEGATFDDQTNTFTWTPTLEQVGENFKFYLFLTDGIRQDHQPVSITVLEPVAEITGLYVMDCGFYIRVIWAYGFDDFDHYRLQWSTDSEFNTLTGEYSYIGASRTWVNVMHYQLEGIGKTYYFRIAVVDGSGNERWSEVKSVDYPDKVAEITNLVNMGSYIKVYYGYVCPAHHFYLQWSTDSTFNTLTGEMPFVSGTRGWVNIMDYLLDGTGKTYYFRIKACDESNCGFWSETESIYY